MSKIDSMRHSYRANPFNRPFFLLRLNSLWLIALISMSVASAAPEQGKNNRRQKKQSERVVINHTVKDIDGQTVKLSDYRGKSLLIVNTASYCGYTRQYADLKALQDKFSSRGFTVLAFPCNDFGGQEPGSPQEIKRFCKARFEVNFPLFEKVRAKGDKSPLYKTLTEETRSGIKGEIRWNFTKFLVNPNGEVVARFESGVNPNSDQVHKAIESTLTSKE